MSDATVIRSYDLERRPTARRVLAMTHLMFWGEAGTGPAPSFLRGVLAPAAAPLSPPVPVTAWHAGEPGSGEKQRNHVW